MSDPLDRTPSFAPLGTPVHHVRASKRPRQQGRYSSEEPEEAPCDVHPQPSTPARPTRQAAGCEPNQAVPPTRDSKTSTQTEYRPRKFGKSTCPIITQSPCGVSKIGRTFSRRSPQPRTCRHNPHRGFPRYQGKTAGDNNDADLNARISTESGSLLPSRFAFRMRGGEPIFPAFLALSR
jgi:hypothetical protein